MNDDLQTMTMEQLEQELLIVGENKRFLDLDEEQYPNLQPRDERAHQRKSLDDREVAIRSELTRRSSLGRNVARSLYGHWGTA